MTFFACSGPNDHVFVYFTDHGAPGLIAFPESEVSLINRQVSSGLLVPLDSSKSKHKYRNAMHLQYVLKQLCKFCCRCYTDCLK